VVNLSRILVPIEFSPRCGGALQYAEALAGRFRSEIILLHALIPPWATYSSLEAMGYTAPTDLAREIFDQRTADLETIPCTAPGAYGVRRVVIEGDPARVIVDYAASESCDLIVMPTHGYGPFRRFLLGSVTAKVLHDAACPVWTGPHMENAPDRAAIAFHNVACAVDLGPHSREVLKWAADLAKHFGAELTVLHAVPAAATRVGNLYLDPEWAFETLKAARERIEFTVKDLGIAAKVWVGSDETATAVRSGAEEAKADVIVIGRGSASRAHRHLPTNSYAIVREAPCPVVTI
jgi:nucleotide-binding universal stress UspA family protein